jgi:2-polyprenyl-6-methoxyphenol hydroxylase-like FAD-dependent oxidoreductase
VTGHAVVIAGGGPAGMMLAAELALAGIDVAIVERRAGLGLPGALTAWFGPPTAAEGPPAPARG